MTKHFTSTIKSLSLQYGSREKATKRAVYLKLDETTVEWFRQSGTGYQVRINQVLREFVHLMKLQESATVVEEAPNILKVVRLGQELFEKFYSKCFWHMRPDLIVTENNLSAIIQGLKLHGGREGFLEAERLCR